MDRRHRHEHYERDHYRDRDTSYRDRGHHREGDSYRDRGHHREGDSYRDRGHHKEGDSYRDRDYHKDKDHYGARDHRGHRDRHRNPRSLNIDRVEDRVAKRHKIGERGVPSQWGESPSPPRRRSKRSRSGDRGKDEYRSSSRKHRRRRHHSSDQSGSESSSDTPDQKININKSSNEVVDHTNNQEVVLMNEEENDVQIIGTVDKKKDVGRVTVIKKEGGEEETMDSHIEQMSTDKPGTSSSANRKLNPKDFGKALLPGEGAAMAAFVAEGKRIPRRGEIGLTSEEIENFERQGYVMSGSRHRRMEAVRLRKENQLYSADEKRALAQYDHEKRAKKDQKIQQYLKQFIEAKQSPKSDDNDR